ncbi:MAG: fibronectin type III domain-containing protein, partial [Armatimonadota bacterium]|nr:fibronectin type III domain-containing protein [Armatimonadota bacterium]
EWTTTDAPALATTLRLPARAQTTAELSTTLPADRVRLWHFDHPHLYNFETTVTADNKLLHAKTDRFGIRKVEVTKDQLFLNGEAVRLPGFNRAHDHRVWGNTEPEHLVRQDVDLMKRLGARMMRIMHGAQASNLLDYLDEKGMLIFTEIPVWGGVDPRMKEEGYPTARRWLREMIERDYNHPCIIGWSVGNELTNHYDYVKTMIDYVRQDLDPHRLLAYVSYTGARSGMGPHNDPITFSDIALQNDYGPKLGATAATLKTRWPGKAVFFSEFGAGQIGLTLDATIPGLEGRLDSIRQERPYVVGASLWTYNDYRSGFSGTPPSEDRAWGVVNNWRQPKRAFEQTARQFSPLRSLTVQHRDLPEAGQPVRSCIQFEVRGNGDFPTYTLHDYRLKWEVRLQDGTISDGGIMDLPLLKPGDAIQTRLVSWKMPAEPLKSPVLDLVASVIAPTDDVIHQHSEPLGVPAAPQIVSVIPGDKAVRVVFRPVPGADEYKVFYGTTALSGESKEATIEPQLVINGLNNGTSYQFAVIALNGKGRSQPSAMINATPNGQPLPPVIWKIVPVDGGFTVGYAVAKEDRQFTVEYGTQPERLDQTLAGLAVKGACAVTGLANDVTYYFRMKRHGDYGESGWSPVLEVTPRGQKPPLPPRLLGVVRGPGMASLRFEPGEQATGYRIRYGSSGGPMKTVEVNSAAVGQATVRGLENGQSYTFAIAAVGEHGESIFSSPVTSARLQ